MHVITAAKTCVLEGHALTNMAYILKYATLSSQDTIYAVESFIVHHFPFYS